MLLLCDCKAEGPARACGLPLLACGSGFEFCLRCVLAAACIVEKCFVIARRLRFLTCKMRTERPASHTSLRAVVVGMRRRDDV